MHMTKPTLIVIFLLSSSLANCQQDLLIFKKRNKVFYRYWEGSTIAFQLSDKEWQKGEITKIQNDSFYIRPRIIKYYMMGSDTFYYPIKGFAVTDVSALPNKGILIDYRNDRYQFIKSAGHVHFYWIKSGWLFRTLALGYAGLHVTNGLINNNLSWKKSQTPLLIAAGVFIGGVLLKKNYQPALRIGKKYSLSILSLSN